ncbi:MAG: WD40 repeat protein [Myxococcota bacterium]|jgi:WD40 repeat protein
MLPADLNLRLDALGVPRMTQPLLRQLLVLTLGAASFVPSSQAAGLDFAALSKLKGTAAVLFATKPGGTVTVSGKALAEGTAVVLKDRSGMIGMGDAEADILVDGKPASVPSVHVIDAESLSISPTGDAAVFHTTNTCGDYCYSQIWLLRENGSRVQVADQAGPFPHVAWSKDGKLLAIGSRGLYVGDPTGKLVLHDSYSSPSFGPNGQLYVRGNDGNDAVYVWGKTPKQLLKYQGTRPESESEADMGDPTPVRFKKGRIHAVFERGEKRITRTTKLR